MTPAGKVYQAYRDEPERHERSNLFNHYTREFAYAAWRAGRDKFLEIELSK
jgi:hypothetical protein